MPQLHLYVSDELARQVRERARSKGVPVSRYLGDLVQREVLRDWPEGWFDRVVGGWRGEPLVRPEQQEAEVRDPLEGRA